MFRQRNPLLLISAAQERLRKWIGPISASPAAVPSIFRIPTAALSFSSKRSENSSSQRPKSLKYLSLALMAGTAATTLALLNDERRKKTFAQIHHFHQSLLAKPATHSILEIPGLAQNEGAIHGVSTRELGNFGFITLNDGVKAKDLIADISQGIDEVARFTKQKSDIRAQGKKPLLILNETAYATTTAPGLLKDSENQAQLILSLTEANIEKFIAENRFPETGEFAALRDKCIRVTADGFVSNLSQFAEYQLYFAVNTADAAPVILVDKLKGIIGIMTCSWHNIAKAELDELIKKMIQLGAKPSQMSMGIGPGLGPNSFEFNTSDTRNFYEPGIIDKRDGRAFQGRPSLKKHISPNPKDPQKSFLNIPGMLSEIAVEQGIPKTQIHFDSSWDSMTNSNFFSARRSTPPEQREVESQKKYPKTARGITFVHGLFKKKTAIKPLESAYGSKLHSWRNFR